MNESRNQEGTRSAANTVRIERVVTAGTFSLDGGTWDVENNVWLVGDDEEVVVVDAAHDARPIIAAIGSRRVLAIACTHAHDDHVTVAPMLSALTGAPVRLHRDDDALWQMVHPRRRYVPLADGEVITVGGVDLHVIHTPGHARGAVCFYAPELRALFSGDTLFKGGPGATGRSFSNYGTIIASIEHKLLTLPFSTTVLTGHGDSTTIGAEGMNLREWKQRDD